MQDDNAAKNIHVTIENNEESACTEEGENREKDVSVEKDEIIDKSEEVEKGESVEIEKNESIDKSDEVIAKEDDTEKDGDIEKDAGSEKTTSRKPVVIGIVIAAVALVLIVVAALVLVPQTKHNNAVKLVHDGSYSEAIDEFNTLNCDDKDAYIAYCNGQIAMESEDYSQAITYFEDADIEDSSEKAAECEQLIAQQQTDSWNYMISDVKNDMLSTVSSLNRTGASAGLTFTYDISESMESETITITIQDITGKYTAVWEQGSNTSNGEQMKEGLDGMCSGVQGMASASGFPDVKVTMSLASGDQTLYTSVNGESVD